MLQGSESSQTNSIDRMAQRGAPCVCNPGMICSHWHKENAMIIELGKITLQTHGGGMTYREDSGNHCLITRTEYIDEAC
jgi:hypothetical protein